MENTGIVFAGGFLKLVMSTKLKKNINILDYLSSQNVYLKCKCWNEITKMNEIILYKEYSGRVVSAGEEIVGLILGRLTAVSFG